MDKSLKQQKYLSDLEKIASKQGGKCLSCIYKNSVTPLKWECNRGHTWAMKPSYIKDGSWCKKCKKINILKGMKEYAESRGGKCLSENFVSSRTKLIWQCRVGHTWESNSAKYNRSWCPYCAKSVFISEAKCRFIFEKLTGYKFPTNRSTLEGFELDGYCEDLQIAFEYHGKQHFEFIKHFHKSISLAQRQKIDLKKVLSCQDKGIALLVIPYWKNLDDDSLLSLITNWLTNKIAISEWHNHYWQFFYKSFINPLNNLQEMAHKKNGKLLSIQYYGAWVPLDWKCQCGHVWTKAPSSIQQGHWCPKCSARATAHRNKHPISDIQNLAKENHSIFMSKTYKNNITPIEWKCEICQKSWTVTLNCMKTRLLKGKWCLFCNKQKEKKCLQVDEKHKM